VSVSAVTGWGARLGLVCLHIQRALAMRPA